MDIDFNLFANEWIDSWNSHDLERILSHYADDFEITSPMIRAAAGIEADSLKGKVEISKYWETALSKIPDLKFELLDVTRGADSVALYYKSVMNKRCVEVMYLNSDNKISKVVSHYTG